ncbi:restriction endonuclease [Streptomyces phytophilus]|uniref:restriction endonuclease n=1 Tax=Streptomyces phytophilus TaxID=722715 RepID=UPI00215D7FA8|nr:restriction endonuclease [Streptomyces phytophilus]
MQPWKRYQYDAAQLLSELGFAVQVEDQIASSRGVTHEVDVSARRTVAGVEVLWVVECKLWRSRVDKEKVAALSAICEDLGADRGLLMSEAGFQSGALQMASGRNITLTSLEDLRSTAALDLQLARQHQADHRLRAVEMELREMRDTTIGESFGELLKVIYLLGLSQDEHAQRAEEAEARPTVQDVLAVKDRVNQQHPDLGQKEDADRRRAIRTFERVERMLQTSVPSKADQEEVGVLAKVAVKCRTSLDEGALGKWPVLAEDQEGTLRTTWCMRQLLDVLEMSIVDLSRRVDIQRQQVERERTDAAS